MITSVQNPKVKWVHALQTDPGARRQAGAFVVEGVRLGEEALAASWPAQLLLCAGDLSPRARSLVDGFASLGVPVEEASTHVLRAASDTQTPQGVLVVLSIRELPLPASPSFVFVPDGVRDPGNLGSMLRTAAAAGVDAALLPPGGVDAYSPKVVRAAMGAHFRLAHAALPWSKIETIVRKAGLCVYLADAGAGEPYASCDLGLPLALVVGGEAQGAGDDARRLAHARLRIPMAGGVESLNAAAAAAVLLFETARQRAERL